MALPDEMQISPPTNKQKNLFYAAFIVINLFLSCYYLDIWVTPNTIARAVPVLSLYEDKTLVIDKYIHYAVDVSEINNHYYSNKAPLTTFLVYPFYALYENMGLPELKDSTFKKYPIYIFERIKPNFDGRSQLLPKSATVLILGDILCGAIPFVIILLLLLFAIKQTSVNTSPVVLIMLTFYSAFLFAYSAAYTSHVLAGVFALAGYVFVKKKKYVLSGIMLGLAVATEYPLGILIPAWMLVIYLNERKINKPLLFAAGVIPGLLVVLFYNYYLTGSMLKTAYSYEIHQHKQATQDIGFYFPSFTAFWGLVLSTYRGVLYYTPILVFMLWYVLKYGYQNLIKRAKDKMELVKTWMKNYLLITIVIYMLLYTSYYEWAGGWAFGPRYLIPLVIIVLYEGVLFLSARPFSVYVFYAVAALGIVFTWLDKSTKIFEISSNPSHSGNPLLDVIIPDFVKHQFNTNTLPVLMFNGNPVVAIYAWPVLFIASLIVLTIWYSKLYPLGKSIVSSFIPALPLFILYVICLVPQNVVGENKFSLDTSGIFGVWKDYDLASACRNAAKNSKAPERKAQLYSYAIKEYKKVIEHVPNSEDSYNSMGVCYSGEGKLDSALYAYKMAFEVNRKFALAAYNAGLIYSRTKQYDSGIHYFQMSYKADSNLSALIDIGVSYQILGNYPKAFHYDSLVLVQDPNNMSVLKNMAIMRKHALKMQ